MLYEVHVRNAWEGHITAEARLNSAAVRWDGWMKVMAAAAALRSSREMSDGMRVLVQSCEWIMDKRRALCPSIWVAACVGPEVSL